jgi:hypothetical protein
MYRPFVFQNANKLDSTCCGMIAHRMSWFISEHQRACAGIKFFKDAEAAHGVSIQVNAVQFHPVCSECALASSFELAVSASHSPPLQVDNEYTDSNRSEGLFLDFSRMSLNVAGKKLSTSMVIPPPPPLLSLNFLHVTRRLPLPK